MFTPYDPRNDCESRGRENNCGKIFCLCAVTTILVALLTATAGLLIGIYLSALLTPALPAIWIFGIVILVLLIIKFIYDACRCRR